MSFFSLKVRLTIAFLCLCLPPPPHICPPVLPPFSIFVFIFTFFRSIPLLHLCLIVISSSSLPLSFCLSPPFLPFHSYLPFYLFLLSVSLLSFLPFIIPLRTLVPRSYFSFLFLILFPLILLFIIFPSSFSSLSLSSTQLTSTHFE